jgi:RNA polymerase sigma-70 factor (ECF subfamily)
MTDWADIVAQYGPLVWRTAHRLLRNEADASDCFQRTFLAALELARGEAVRHWPALLKRLAAARALECLRQRRRDANRVAALRERSLPDRGAGAPLQAVQASELAEHLRLALSGLDHQQAHVFCLACLEGLSYQEIAEQLGLTVSHVGVLLHRARATLQERLWVHRPARAVKGSGGEADQ